MICDIELEFESNSNCGCATSNSSSSSRRRAAELDSNRIEKKGIFTMNTQESEMLEFCWDNARQNAEDIERISEACELLANDFEQIEAALEGFEARLAELLAAEKTTAGGNQ